MKIDEVTTPLGLKAWLVEDQSTPVVSLSFSFDGGSARDAEAHKGLTSITATLLTDGAGPLDAQAFKRRQEETATSLGFGAELDHWPQAIAAVRPDDVVSAARHVWRDDRSVTSLLTSADGWQ